MNTSRYLVLSDIHLTVPPEFRMHDDAVVIHLNEIDDNDIEQRAGFRLTTPLRTIVDVAQSDTSQEHIDRAVADALEKGVASRRLLRAAADVASDRAALRVERALGVTA